VTSVLIILGIVIKVKKAKVVYSC